MSRYERVEDPETLSVMDAFYVDDTAQIIGGTQTRSKKSFLDPIAIRGKYYDPRLPVNQRTLCIGLALIVACGIAAAVSLTLLGANHVLGSKEKERNRYGIQMIPDLHQLTGGVMHYSRRLDMNSTRMAYVENINTFLDIYVKDQQERADWTVDCAEGQHSKNKWCRFDITRAFHQEGRGCTRYDAFGYENGSPCALFALKDEIQWRPRVANNVTDIPFKCDIKPNRPSSHPPASFYFPSLGKNTRLGGFPVNKLPSLVVNDVRGEPISDEDGETIFDLPPLIFVKLSLPEAPMHYTITCSIRDDVSGNEIENLNDFEGRTSFKFDVEVS